MGACNSCGESQDQVAASKKTKSIDAQIKRDKKDMDREVKMLLLGAGESGKSTIAKQMRIIFLEGFSDEERVHYKEVIYSNMITSMTALLNATAKFDYELEEQNKRIAEELLANTNPMTNEINEELARDLKALWHDPAVLKAMGRSSEFQLYDSTEYYFTDIHRITAPNYVPSEQDILRSRAKTTGIIETEFEVDGLYFRLVDVGGQRSERKKWIHCFQDVTAVVFCVAMSEYDLKLYEDETVNRMDESLKLFDEICNSKWFTEVNIILFLNKSDIFAEKIKKVDLSVCFPDYKGGLNFEKACGFLQKKFVKLNKNPKRKEIYCHVTCATDTQNITFVFNVVKDIIIRKVLVGSGVI